MKITVLLFSAAIVIMILVLPSQTQAFVFAQPQTSWSAFSDNYSRTNYSGYFGGFDTQEWGDYSFEPTVTSFGYSNHHGRHYQGGGCSDSETLATPEPTTILLMGLGLVGTGLVTRRRK